MAEKVTMYCLSEIVGSTRAKEFKGSAEEPFGGMNSHTSRGFPSISTRSEMHSAALYVEREEDSCKSKDRKRVLRFRVILLQSDVYQNNKTASSRRD